MKRAALALVAILAIPAVAAAQKTVDQKLPAAPEAAVKIENLAGSTRVTGWDRPEVQVKGTLCPECELSLKGTQQQVQVEIDSHHVNPMAGKSDIEVMVPAGGAISVEGFNATVTVTGVTGSVKAETVNGSITHAGGSKEVQLQSVQGAVDTTKPSGRVHVEAVNGTVTVHDGSGELEASTVNGKLTVSGGSWTRAHLESVGGPVRFDSTVPAKGTLGVETVSGTVDLLLPAGFAADFTVTTFSGAIANELGPAAQKKSDWTPEKELTFTSGPGGARVSVETLSGAVSIRKKQ